MTSINDLPSVLLPALPTPPRGAQSSVRPAEAISPSTSVGTQPEEKQRALSREAVNSLFVERSASAASSAALANRTRRAIGAYNGVADQDERDFVSKVFGINTKA